MRVLQGMAAGLRSELRKVLIEGQSKARVAAFSLLAGRSGWDALTDILTALALDDRELSPAAWDQFHSWHYRYSHRAWVKPDAETLAEIEAILAERRVKTEPPDSVRGRWQDLPRLIQDGKKLWGQKS